MTKTERNELSRVVRMRAKVAKDDADLQGARLLADFEAQLTTQYPENHPAWASITSAARQAVTEADQKISRICQEVGIPAEFRPGISFSWARRGENAFKERRDELRNTAKKEIAARVQNAKAVIDRHVTELLTELVATGLETEQARAFLEKLPKVEDLIPRLGFSDIESQVIEVTKERAALLAKWTCNSEVAP